MESADIIIIGSGMSGLYSAYTIQAYSPETSFLILEKYKKQWIGGRASNDTFYGTEIVTGAGIGRKRKDKLLYKCLLDLGFDAPHEYTVNPQKILKNEVDILPIVEQLKGEYSKYQNERLTFKQFATRVLGARLYRAFIESAGYTDYENEDAFETLYYYGLEDNACCWKAFSVPWREMVMRLYDRIGADRFRFSNKAISITKTGDGFIVSTENGKQYRCKKVIVATTIQGIRQLFPSKPIYKDIEGQPFLRLYAKFDKRSSAVLREKLHGFTFVSKPLQRIIPMDAEKGVYMIAYNDNENTLALKSHLENNEENREFYAREMERVLDIPGNTLNILAIKEYYWPVGTHYYKPLNKRLYVDRKDFIDKAQHPEEGILVVGEVVSRNQGWTEGALESVKAVVSKRWLKE